jgi:acyl-CoA synthetase (NDP forming)
VATTGMVVAGPNLMGFANLNRQVHTSFVGVQHLAHAGRQRRVSLLTQSGNVCAAVYAIARRLGVEFSHFINTGNEACVDLPSTWNTWRRTPAPRSAWATSRSCATARAS